MLLFLLHVEERLPIVLHDLLVRHIVLLGKINYYDEGVLQIRITINGIM